MDSPKVRQRSSYQNMYKSPGNRKGLALNEYDSNNNESPSWRNSYKKRCFDQFKKSRQKLVNRFRTLDVSGKDQKSAKDYLEEELQKICLLEANTQPELKITPDEANEIYKQIQLELIPQSSDYSDNQWLEMLGEWELDEKISQEAISNNSSTYVVCPLCQKSNLIQDNPGLICCKNKPECCFKIDQTQVKCDLNSLSTRLQGAIGGHDCSGVPSFQFKADIVPGSADAVLLGQLSGSSRSSFLLMSCDKCQFMEFIF